MAEVELQVEEDLTRRLERRAEATLEKLRDLCAGCDEIALELRDKFVAAVGDVQRVQIQQIEVHDGAFVVEGNVLRVDENPIAELIAAVIDDLKGDGQSSEITLAPFEIPELLERIFVDYVLHELRHRSQGVSDYSTVAELKKVAGSSQMAQLDLFADRDAAFGYAAVFSQGDTRTAFLSSFQEALFFSFKYFFRVFPPEASRTDKLERTLGLLLMAARLASAEASGTTMERDANIPLDAPLVVRLSAKHTQLAVFRGEPSLKLLAVAKEEDGIRHLVKQICDNDIDGALSSSIRLVHGLKLT